MISISNIIYKPCLIPSTYVASFWLTTFLHRWLIIWLRLKIIKFQLHGRFLKPHLQWCSEYPAHYNDVIMGTMASQFTSLTIIYLSIYSGADHRKHQSSASLAFVRGIHRWPWTSNEENVPIWWRHHEISAASWLLMTGGANRQDITDR